MFHLGCLVAVLQNSPLLCKRNDQDQILRACLPINLFPDVSHLRATRQAVHFRGGIVVESQVRDP
jgi:hypothetical protein